MVRLLIALPFLALLVLFALSNPQHVQLGLWPTDLSVSVSLAIAVLAAMGIGLLAGALLLWVGGISVRLRARRAEHTVRLLEAQVAELKAEVTSLRTRNPRAPGAIAAPELAPTWPG
jgi:uncharacterized membrane protein YciS (DUF1049 family)